MAEDASTAAFWLSLVILYHICYNPGMGWTIEYYEQEDSVQPAETFEDQLAQDHPKLRGKLLRITDQLKVSGPRVGGGLVEACRGYKGLLEMRAIYGQWLARELFGFDGQQVILLHGYVKRGGDEASAPDLKKASRYWQDYQQTHKVSLAQEEETDESL